MKVVFGLLMLGSLSCYGNTVTNKNPSAVDISIDDLVEFSCGDSGYFNPLVCVNEVTTCYQKAQWPKTISVRYKIAIVNQCLSKFVLR